MKTEDSREDRRPLTDSSVQVSVTERYEASIREGRRALRLSDRECIFLQNSEYSPKERGSGGEDHGDLDNASSVVVRAFGAILMLANSEKGVVRSGENAHLA